MKIHYLLIVALGCFSANIALADPPAVTQLLNEYAARGANNPDPLAGQRLWSTTFKGDKRFPERSCASCHTKNLKQTGKHLKTTKVIDPMAPSVNAERLISSREIKKWFKRNCKWTLGRECTAVEKANLLAYLKQQ
jgi:hypothetical protein